MWNSSPHPTTRRQWLGAALAASGLSAGSCAGRGVRPNILWMIAEDFSPDLSCYGNRDLETPALDGLARQGMRFTRAFVTGPVCSASRSALAVGMYQTSVGGHNHRSHRGDGYRLPSHVRPFTHYLREAGYHTSNLKNTHGLHGTGKTDLNYEVENLFDGEDWAERADGQPFYAQINFSETHRAFRRFPDDPTDPAKLTSLPPYYPDHPAIRLDWACYLDTAKHLDRKAAAVLARLEQEGLADNTIVFFFGDHGRPMPRGKQFVYDGGIRIPLIVRIPERFAPQGYRSGRTFDDLVSSIDITATTLRLAGVEPPAHMEGRPFYGPGVRPRDYVVAARDRCDETVDRIRAIRDRRYKYIRNFLPNRPYTQQNVYKDTQYPALAAMRQLNEEGKLTGPAALFMGPDRPAEELYDLESDPFELHNLAAAPEHAARLDQMRRLLETWIKETGDQGQTFEKENPEAYRTNVDGWCSRDQTRLEKADGVLRVQTAGPGAQVLRSYVAEGPELEIEFRARSREVAVTSFLWGAIEDPQNKDYQAPVGFTADGSWRDYRVPFKVQGWLGRMALQFSDQAGRIDFQWIRLAKLDRGRRSPVREWRFG